MNQATKDFILRNVNVDITSLALKKNSSDDVDYTLALKQIEGMQKIKGKVPIFFNHSDILYPQKLSLEQSSSEITAKYKSSLCKGNIFVDLTGGFGIDCVFLSENFKKSIYVERQTELCTLAKHNFAALNKPNIEIYNISAEDFLENDFTADWIFIDPARRKESGAKAVLLSDCEPNVVNLQSKLLEKAENVMIKLSPMIDLSQLQRELTFVKEIHVIAVENECKEILIILKRNYKETISIKAIHFPKNKNVETFEFTDEEEKNCISFFSDGIDKYLYEPNVATLKSGAFKSVGNQFNINKLHVNSHLYTSNEFITDFQGRSFEVKEVLNFNKEELKRLKLDKANITVRNFPLSVNELRKKLKIKEGGDEFIFATTLYNEKKVLVICNKII